MDDDEYNSEIARDEIAPLNGAQEFRADRTVAENDSSLRPGKPDLAVSPITAKSSGSYSLAAGTEVQGIEYIRGRRLLSERKAEAFEHSRRAQNLPAMEKNDIQLDVELETQLSVISPTIHIIGTGPVGKFIAHSVASLPQPPPAILLVHTRALLQQYNDEGNSIRLLRGGQLDEQRGVHVELSSSHHGHSFNDGGPGFRRTLKHYSVPMESVIENLIVTTVDYTTIFALSAIKHRLRSRSTICFVHGSLGMVEEVNTKIFPDPTRRPTYILAKSTHKFESTMERFLISHKDEGDMTVVKLPHESRPPLTVIASRGGVPVIRKTQPAWNPSAQYLMRVLTRSPRLNVRGLNVHEFFISHLQSLAVNAVIGPLSVLFDCANDGLLHNYAATLTIRQLLVEISSILRLLPEVSRSTRTEKCLSAHRLEQAVVTALEKSGRNLSSMLKNVRAGRRTQVDLYNGYLVKRARELGLGCSLNMSLISMVKAKAAVRSRDLNAYIPF